MKCSNCGKQLLENMRFCDECGTAVTDNKPQKARKSGNSSKKRVAVLSGVLAGSILVSGAALAADEIIRRNNMSSVTEQGLDFLKQENYEQAAFCFGKALEYNGNDAQAYLGKAKALAAIGRKDEAAALLELGMSKCSDERLKEYSDELKAQTDLDSVQPLETAEAVIEEPVTAEAKTEEASEDTIGDAEIPAADETEENSPAENAQERSYKDFVREDDYYQFYNISGEHYRKTGRTIKAGIAFLF